MQYALSLRYAGLPAMLPISSSPCRVPLYFFLFPVDVSRYFRWDIFHAFTHKLALLRKGLHTSIHQTSHSTSTKTTKKYLIMENSFFNMDDSIDSENSFLNIPGTPGRAGSDFSYYGDNDTSLFSQGDQSPPPFPMTPGPAASQSPVRAWRGTISS